MLFTIVLNFQTEYFSALTWTLSVALLYCCSSDVMLSAFFFFNRNVGRTRCCCPNSEQKASPKHLFSLIQHLVKSLFLNVVSNMYELSDLNIPACVKLTHFTKENVPNPSENGPNITPLCFYYYFNWVVEGWVGVVWTLSIQLHSHSFD